MWDTGSLLTRGRTVDSEPEQVSFAPGATGVIAPDAAAIRRGTGRSAAASKGAMTSALR